MDEYITKKASIFASPLFKCIYFYVNGRPRHKKGGGGRCYFKG